MKTVKVKAKQTIFDVVLEQYGTLEAVGEVVAANPGLKNDTAALATLGIDSVGLADFYPDVALEAGQSVTVDENSPLCRRGVLKLINSEITTFDL